MKLEKRFEDCYVQFNDDILRIGNDKIERTWSFENDFPSVLSLKNKKNNREWFTGQWKEENTSWPVYGSRRAFYKKDLPAGTDFNLQAAAFTDNDLGMGKQHLKVEIVFDYGSMMMKWVHIIYPKEPVMRTCIEYHGKEQNKIRVGKDTMVSQSSEAEASLSEVLCDDFVDFFPIEPKHCRWTSVTFNDRTDQHNNLVKTEEGLFYPYENDNLKGNLLFIRDNMTEEGITIVKEGPTPLAYQGEMSHDFQISGNNIFSCGWGITESDLRQNSQMTTYGSAIILWDEDDREGMKTLQSYHRCLHRYNPSKDAFIMSNTWGDRSKDGRLTEKFVLEELEIGRCLNINYYQIDDGWQAGATENSVVGGGVWEGYYNTDSRFWDVNKERFPNGLRPIAEAAKRNGIKLGLWFSPDSADDFSNWEKDGDTLIDLHNKYGIISFKIDAINIRSKKGEENLFNMQQKVLRETENRVFFNLDVTAQVRSGYFGRIQYSNLFLENRYTDWNNYYPHWTLRNLWMLSKYYPTYRFQVEFLNVNRNTKLYHEDPLSPESCGIEYAFAVTMFANPLAWMELSGLDHRTLTLLEHIIKTYKEYQRDILSGCVYPIGEEPSGCSFTGFQSVTGENTGYLLILKERNHNSSHRYLLKDIKGRKIQQEKILGDGCSKAADVDDNGEVTFELAGYFKYSLFHYTVF